MSSASPPSAPGGPAVAALSPALPALHADGPLPLRREAKAAEYRGLALEAAALAEAAVLAQVREKHATAAARWTALAVFNEREAEVSRAATQVMADRRAAQADRTPREVARHG